ncbi:MAG TPA: hypothetical protein DCL42_04935 [Deltaproteobacteria bacterium]|nr:hypothetical protein [Deltaproteobacteria bacterium]
MGFPKEIFGRCPECGGNAADQEVVSSADAAARDTEGSGYPLEYYQGRLMCQLCIKRLQADEESRIDAEKQAGAEQFRGAAGFTRTVS